jgi:cholesterol transport system auxiliary component
MRKNNLVWPWARAGAGAVAICLVAACGVIPKREPISVYEPPAPSTPSATSPGEWPQANWSLLVPKPAASQLLDNDRIVVRPDGGEITVYKGAAWPETAPEMVQSAVLRRFEDSGRILSVARPGVGVRGDYQLQMDLRTFESNYTAPGRPEAQVEIYARLVHTADGEVAAARSFRETEAAAGEGVDAVVSAFGVALGRASSQVAAWTLQAGNEHEHHAKR